MNILHITPDFNYSCGRSYYVFLLLKYFKKLGNNVILLTDRGDSFDRLKQFDIEFILREKLHFKTPATIKKNIDFVANLLDEKKIDILHTHHRMSEFIGLRAIKYVKKRKTRSVITVLSYVKKKYSIEYKSDHLIAISNNIYHMLVNRFNVPENKIILIPNFIDSDELNRNYTARMISRTKDEFILLTVCRFHKDKNIQLLLEALNEIKDNNIRLILIGEGELKKKILGYVRRYKLNVDLHPPQRFLSDYFLNSDISVLTSEIDPFPTFMLQSGLYKKAFIGTDISGINELIRDNNNGILFSKNDLGMLREKILLLKNDKQLRKKLGDNLSNDVINNFTEKTCIPKIDKLYHKMLDEI